MWANGPTAPHSPSEFLGKFHRTGPLNLNIQEPLGTAGIRNVSKPQYPARQEHLSPLCSSGLLLLVQSGGAKGEPTKVVPGRDLKSMPGTT